MANRDKSCWLSKPRSPSEVQLHIHGVTFTLDRELVAAKSAKLAALLKENAQESLSYPLLDIPADPETFEIVARFCYGYELKLSSENVIPLTCLSYYLEMNESYSENNLLRKGIAFFEQNVLPSWNETIKAFCSTGSNLQQAMHLGLFNACLESLTGKALADPRLLGEPIKNPRYDKDGKDEEEMYKPNARKRLFALDWQSEDVTALPLQLYEPLIQTMNRHGVPPEYVAASLCRYATKWVFCGGIGGENVSIYKRNTQRDVIEAVERLLPQEKGLIPCTLISEMLSFASSLESSNACRNGLEIRIGRQLDEATVKDLLIPSQGYSKEVQYDIECLKRILKHFYENYSSSDNSGIFIVAELIEEFLLEVASDIDLKKETFISLAEMSKATSFGTPRNSDGIYRAIDIYFERHSHLTSLEREEVCRVLDCQNMSPEAWEHAATNEKLPVRFLVQVLIVAQLHMQNTISNKVLALDDQLRRQEGEDEGSETKGIPEEEEMRAEMEKMSVKVTELERECFVMRKEIENGCSSSHQMKKGKVSVWREMKRKLGCVSSIRDCNCQVKKKKVHPRY